MPGRPAANLLYSAETFREAGSLPFPASLPPAERRTLRECALQASALPSKSRPRLGSGHASCGSGSHIEAISVDGRATPCLSEDADDVQVIASELFAMAGMGAWHTSIIVGNREYYFDQDGIQSAPPFWSHLVEDFNVQVRNYGKSGLTGPALLKGLRPFFEEGTYDLIRKNCNAWTECALYFLTRKRLDPQFSRLERVLGSTMPMSVGLINTMMRGWVMPWRDPPEADYAPNPLAVNFSVETVIALCDALDPKSAAPAPRPSRWGPRCCAALCEEEHVQTSQPAPFVSPSALDDLPGDLPVPPVSALREPILEPSDRERSASSDCGGALSSLRRERTATSDPGTGLPLRVVDAPSSDDGSPRLAKRRQVPV